MGAENALCNCVVGPLEGGAVHAVVGVMGVGAIGGFGATQIPTDGAVGPYGEWLGGLGTGAIRCGADRAREGRVAIGLGATLVPWVTVDAVRHGGGLLGGGCHTCTRV